MNRIKQHADKAGETLNQGCLILLAVAFLAGVITYNNPPAKAANSTHYTYEEKAGDIAETQYTLALAVGAVEGKRMAKLSETQLQRMDQLALAQTPEPCRKRLKCDAFTQAGF